MATDDITIKMSRDAAQQLDALLELMTGGEPGVSLTASDALSQVTIAEARFALRRALQDQPKPVTLRDWARRLRG